MNAKESIAADRAAEAAIKGLLDLGDDDGNATAEAMISGALIAIALELRAARVYANYLEGRETRAMPVRSKLVELGLSDETPHTSTSYFGERAFTIDEHDDGTATIS